MPIWERAYGRIVGGKWCEVDCDLWRNLATVNSVEFNSLMTTDSSIHNYTLGESELASFRTVGRTFCHSTHLMHVKQQPTLFGSPYINTLGFHTSER
jgi:hypothetical protein